MKESKWNVSSSAPAKSHCALAFCINSGCTPGKKWPNLLPLQQLFQKIKRKYLIFFSFSYYFQGGKKKDKKKPIQNKQKAKKKPTIPQLQKEPMKQQLLVRHTLHCFSSSTLFSEASPVSA